MLAGRLRDWVTLQQKSVARDAVGGETITWVDVVSFWSSVESVALREYVENRASQADITLKVTARFRTGVAPEMRILWKTNAYPIAEVLYPAKRGIMREIVLMCTGEAKATNE